MIDRAQQLATHVGVTRACEVLTVPRSSFYRTPGRPRGEAPESTRRTAPERALTSDQRLEVRDLLNSDEFCDHAPRQVWARLLDQGRYLCSWRTMYRILHAFAEVKERRNLRRHPTYTQPELMATAPNEVWTWDITKLRGPRDILKSCGRETKERILIVVQYHTSLLRGRKDTLIMEEYTPASVKTLICIDLCQER